MPALAHQHLSLMAQCERTETPSAQKDIPARRERLRVSELKQRDALNADGVHTGGQALGWHTVRASVCLRNVSETIDLIQTRELAATCKLGEDH